MLTLEREGEGTSAPSSISIPCRVARHGPDGVGVSFLLHIDEDREALHRFMRGCIEMRQLPNALGDAVITEGQAVPDEQG